MRNPGQNSDDPGPLRDEDAPRGLRIPSGRSAPRRAICYVQRNAAGEGAAKGLAYPGGVPSALSLTLGSVLVLAGAALLVIAFLGARGALPRNRFAGVRTAATLVSEQAFAVANKVAAPLVGAAGAVAVVGGGALLATPSGALGWVLLAVAAVGTVVLAGMGGALGDRAAQGVEEPPAACSGVCAGCDLIAGCQHGTA